MLRLASFGDVSGDGLGVIGYLASCGEASGIINYLREIRGLALFLWILWLSGIIWGLGAGLWTSCGCFWRSQTVEIVRFIFARTGQASNLMEL